MDFDSSEEEDVVSVLMCSAVMSALAARKPPKRKRRWWVRPCLRSREVAGHASRLLPELRAHDEDYFRDFLRMPPSTFDTLLALLRPSITKEDTNYRPAVSAHDRLAMTIRFLATGETQRDMSFNFLVGRSTTCAIVSEVCDALWTVLKPLYLQHPQGADEWLKVATEFEERWNMPHCVGAIDGKHVSIECPANSGTLDHNYKGTFSKSLLAVCDAQYRFLYVEIGHSGSESDGGIFSRSTLQNEIISGTLGLPPPRTVGSEGLLPYFLVGDEAFPLKDYMMRPYPRRTLHEDSHETHKRRVFNYRLSRARRVIENAFGILAQRWRILRRPFKAKTDNINRYVGACIVLHNFLMKESSASSAAYCPPGSADSEDWEGRLSPGSWRDEEPAGGALLPTKSSGCHAARYAKEVRDKLAHHFITAGQVPWQDKVVTST
ncbi:uncharacterized protein LOC119440412 [Dermacentor silvarum]|uniref:uncharacterized protein LOC119440412 n=1 Tax=Dermacentor silvarum TaxID=543639 RepID=UPI002100A8CA|nr:uncharacterized protein LOC119440412 [Dermacentor silvarum]